MHLVGFIIRIYHDVRSTERQMYMNVTQIHGMNSFKLWFTVFEILGLFLGFGLSCSEKQKLPHTIDCVNSSISSASMQMAPT